MHTQILQWSVEVGRNVCVCVTMTEKESEVTFKTDYEAFTKATDP